jgi:hypothetical protein
MLGHIGLAFSPDGSTLAASGAGGSIHLWETAGWSPLRAFEGHAAPASDAAFAPDGKILATSSQDGSLRLWDVAQGTTITTLQGHTGPANAVAFSPNGHNLASAGDDQLVKVWDVTSGREVATLRGHTTGVRDLAFAPEGRWIASVGGTYHGPTPAEVKIWDWEAGREAATYQGHTGLVTSVAYFPDGHRLATASDDRTIKLWDVQTGEDVLTLRGHTSGVVCLAISRDGRQIASGSIDYTAKIWSTETPESGSAFDLALRRAAVERVQGLFACHLLKEDVLQALRTDRTLSPQLRVAALEVAEHRSENASGLYETAWLTIIRPIGRRDDNVVAMRRLEAACRVVAEDPARLSEYRRALALAYYRNGLPDRALETLRALAAATPGSEPTPLELAITAMAHYQLGRTVESRAGLDRLRSLVKTDRFAHNQEVLGFLHEAEGVVEFPAIP